MSFGKYYAVRVGRAAGVYLDWASCQRQVSGFSGAQFKSFKSVEEAQEYIEGAEAVSRKRVRHECDSQPPPKRICGAAEKLVVYTDGSCLGNGQAGARAGVGVWFGDGDDRNVSEPLGGKRQTNQRAEITAITRAIEKAGDGRRLEVRTDSKYVIKALTSWITRWRDNHFSGVANADLFQELDGVLRSRQAAVDFVHIRAHSGEPGNEAADALARTAAAKSS